MTTTFVTRHQGAIDWAREEGLLEEDSRIAADYDPETAQPGEIVIGTLPAQLAARICERGGRYQHLTLDLGPELRGKELSAAEMRTCNARVEEFFIQRASAMPARSRKLTHLCIVSDQSLQNLLPTRVEDMAPDRCVLLVSTEMKRKGAEKRLRHALAQSGLKQIDLIDDAPDHDVATIIAWGNRLIARLRAEHPDHRFILNLTGGNKLMSIGLLQALRPWCEAIYCDTANDSLETIHPPGKGAVALAPDLLNVKLYLAAQGFSVRDEPRDGMALDKRRGITQWLAGNARPLEDFIRKLNGAAAYYEPNNKASQSPNLAPPRGHAEEDAIKRLTAAGLLEDAGGRARVPAANASYLRGGWLEEYCWSVGREFEDEGLIKRARFDIGVKIDPIEQTRQDRYPLNELDAVFVHRNRMLIIECKTGAQLGDEGKSQSILNRLEVLGEHAAGRFAEKILLTTQSRIDAKTAERARQYRIRVVSAGELPKLKQLVREWMNA